MALNSNFTRVILDDDPSTGGRALFVEGISDPPGATSEIFVALPHNGELLTAPVDNAGLNPWEAKFPEGDTPFQTGDDVFVVGVATRQSPCDPFVWQGSFEIKSRENG